LPGRRCHDKNTGPLFPGTDHETAVCTEYSYSHFDRPERQIDDIELIYSRRATGGWQPDFELANDELAYQQVLLRLPGQFTRHGLAHQLSP